MKLNELLIFAIQNKASDIHISEKLPLVLRINGEIQTVQGAPFTRQETEALVHEMLNDKPEKLKELKEKMEVDFSYEIEDVARFRVSAYYQKGTCAAALRALSTEIPNINDLYLPDAVIKMAQNKRGLILVTGVTGSGKSSTIAAMLDYINKTRKEHILTLEDPIEYLHKNQLSMIHQREVGTDTMSYASGLRSALREDPDVIMIGEMRDLETISIALTAAETGHLVLSTLHTLDAASTIDRIVDVFPPSQQEQIRLQLASVLKGVVSQQLIKTSNGKRVPAVEIMLGNTAVCNLIRESRAHQVKNVLITSTQYGMQTMDMSLVSLFKQEKISQEEMFKNCIDRSYIEKMIF